MAETPSLIMLARDLAEVRREIFGNGKPGIKADVQEHGFQIRAMLAAQAQRHRDAWQIKTLLLAQLMGFLAALVLLWIRGGMPAQ